VLASRSVAEQMRCRMAPWAR